MRRTPSHAHVELPQMRTNAVQTMRRTQLQFVAIIICLSSPLRCLGIRRQEKAKCPGRTNPLQLSNRLVIQTCSPAAVKPLAQPQDHQPSTQFPRSWRLRQTMRRGVLATLLLCSFGASLYLTLPCLRIIITHSRKKGSKATQMRNVLLAGPRAYLSTSQ